MKFGFDWRIEKYMMIIVTYNVGFHITGTSPYRSSLRHASRTSSWKVG